MKDLNAHRSAWYYINSRAQCTLQLLWCGYSDNWVSVKQKFIILNWRRATRQSVWRCSLTQLSHNQLASWVRRLTDCTSDVTLFFTRAAAAFCCPNEWCIIASRRLTPSPQLMRSFLREVYPPLSVCLPESLSFNSISDNFSRGDER